MFARSQVVLNQSNQEIHEKKLIVSLIQRGKVEIQVNLTHDTKSGNPSEFNT